MSPFFFWIRVGRKTRSVRALNLYFSGSLCPNRAIAIANEIRIRRKRHKSTLGQTGVGITQTCPCVPPCAGRYRRAG